jgi:YHS domain-containing protein
MRPVIAFPIVLAMLAVVGCSQNTPTSATPDTSTTSETVATAAPETDLPAVFAEDGIAIKGADPVAYFTDGAYVPGSEEFTYDWGGATWQFANAEHRDTFANDPAAYAPQYAGYCAWAVTQGNKAPIDPEAWKIVDGKLYLNYDKKIQAKWEKDIPGNIAKADDQWPEVAAQ